MRTYLKDKRNCGCDDNIYFNLKEKWSGNENFWKCRSCGRKGFIYIDFSKKEHAYIEYGINYHE
jgi:hypothetical protein